MRNNKVRFWVSRPNICINESKWGNDGNQVLLLTGLVGAGKTTICREFCKKYDSKCISFDALKFYDETNEESKKEIDMFTKIYPEIIPLIKNHWFETDNTNTNDELYTKFCTIFFDYIIEKYNNSNNRIVFEGIQIFVRIPIEKCRTMPCYILRTSAVKCCKRFIHRDFIKSRKAYNFLNLIKLCRTYFIIQLKMINKFINFMGQ